MKHAARKSKIWYLREKKKFDNDVSVFVHWDEMTNDGCVYIFQIVSAPLQNPGPTRSSS